MEIQSLGLRRRFEHGRLFQQSWIPQAQGTDIQPFPADGLTDLNRIVHVGPRELNDIEGAALTAMARYRGAIFFKNMMIGEDCLTRIIKVASPDKALVAVEFNRGLTAEELSRGGIEGSFFPIILELKVLPCNHRIKGDEAEKDDQRDEIFVGFPEHEFTAFHDPKARLPAQ